MYLEILQQHFEGQRHGNAGVPVEFPPGLARFKGQGAAHREKPVHAAADEQQHYAQVAQENSGAQLEHFPLPDGAGQHVQEPPRHQGEEPETGENIIEPQLQHPGAADAAEHFFIGLGSFALRHHAAYQESRQHKPGKNKKQLNGGEDFY